MEDTAARPPEVVPQGSGYQVRLPVFEGPFDLLLQLIARRRLDVSEVDLAEITADFLGSIGRAGDGGAGRPRRTSGADGEAGRDPDHGFAHGLDLDTATRFLLVAATLAELKAARLLPAGQRAEFDDLLVEARDVLYARLLEYRAFHEVSGLLADAMAANEGYVPRTVPLEPRFRQLAPDVDLEVGAEGLGALAAAALAPRPRPTVSLAHIPPAGLSLREAARRLLARLPWPGDGRTFRELVTGLTRSEQVVHFLAALELYKLGYLDLDQPSPFGDLHVERRRAGGADLALLDRLDRPQAPVGAAAADDSDGQGQGAPAPDPR
ncbi:MAG TPA: ScpA family protein [Nitriliruptorales bacterium]|nr:ScpA family protein [Nitriliruptorales bacterium]